MTSRAGVGFSVGISAHGSRAVESRRTQEETSGLISGDVGNRAVSTGIA